MSNLKPAGLLPALAVAFTAVVTPEIFSQIVSLVTGQLTTALGDSPYTSVVLAVVVSLTSAVARYLWPTGQPTNAQPGGMASPMPPPKPVTKMQSAIWGG